MIADYQTLEEKEQDHNFLSYCSLICILCRKKLNLPNVFLHTLQSDQFKYIFKTDDDQMLIKPNFFDTIINLISNKIPIVHYGGYIVDVPQPYLSQYCKVHPELPTYLPVLKTRYCNGRFYFLSSKAISVLISKREKIKEEYLEDYAIGYYLPELYKENMLNISTDKIFKDM